MGAWGVLTSQLPEVNWGRCTKMASHALILLLMLKPSVMSSGTRVLMGLSLRYVVLKALGDVMLSAPSTRAARE
jgi:hypothetical protein